MPALHGSRDDLISHRGNSSNLLNSEHIVIFTVISHGFRFDNIRLELDDVNECFELIKNLVLDTPAEPYFLSGRGLVS